MLDVEFDEMRTIKPLWIPLLDNIGVQCGGARLKSMICEREMLLMVMVSEDVEGRGGDEVVNRQT